MNKKIETVTDIRLGKLLPFQENPFLVRDDEQMAIIVESIRSVGVLVPAIVRPVEGRLFEIIAGHRRKHTCELLELLLHVAASHFEHRRSLLPERLAVFLRHDTGGHGVVVLRRDKKAVTSPLFVNKGSAVRKPVQRISAYQRSLAEFAPVSAKETEIIFSGGVYVGENTFRLAAVFSNESPVKRLSFEDLSKTFF